MSVMLSFRSIPFVLQTLIQGSSAHAVVVGTEVNKLQSQIK